jgi:2-C-methyl-D-erythritol 4-phosphate cytidylyltransferase
MALALLLAAGSGERLGAGTPKAFVELGGRPMLRWSLEALAASPAVERIVVALPPGWCEGFAEVRGIELVTAEGGPSRSESVRAALAAGGPGDPVLVHDAARPLVTADLIDTVLRELEEPGVDAAVLAAPVTDTIKRADSARTVLETLDRSGLWAIQTPQVFRRAALERALDTDPAAVAAATDDAWLVERAGGSVRIVPGPAENLKVTTPLDLRLAELVLAARGRP